MEYVLEYNIPGYDTYVIQDATRGISVQTIDAALKAMKQSGTCHTIACLL